MRGLCTGSPSITDFGVAVGMIRGNWKPAFASKSRNSNSARSRPLAVDASISGVLELAEVGLTGTKKVDENWRSFKAHDPVTVAEDLECPLIVPVVEGVKSGVLDVVRYLSPETAPASHDQRSKGDGPLLSAHCGGAPGRPHVAN